MWNMPKVNRTALPVEAFVTSAAVIAIGVGLFEWVVISPDHPTRFVLRVICADLATTLTLLPIRTP